MSRSLSPSERVARGQSPGGLLATACLVGAVLALLAVACAMQQQVPPLERRAQALNKAIMCPVCPGESIDQSQNSLAAQMRVIVAEKLAEGWSDAQIKAFFVERFDESVLLEPPASGVNLMAWVVPPAVLVAAATALVVVVLRMRRTARGVGGGELTVSERDKYLGLLEPEADSERKAGGQVG